jgi:diguanylate cyclase (GGDEF)-like protein/PAS domain S-box-containing protein
MDVLSSRSEHADAAVGPDVSLKAQREAAEQDRLACARLGVASGLFLALRAKHPPTAAHSVRVALTCSVWSSLVQLPGDDRETLEVAALLHDVGKIGVPDRILTKPGELTAVEAAAMNRHRDWAREILSTCCSSTKVLDSVYYGPAWYDGRDRDYNLHGESLPRTARMLAIADAFDALTSEHVYRRAVSGEQALSELFEYAGTQFDPYLLQEFRTFLGTDHAPLRETIISHWLRDLQDRTARQYWQLRPASMAAARPDLGRLFHEQLLENMHASVVFVDDDGVIVRWSRECEALTGLPAARTEGQVWTPSLLQLRDADYRLMTVEQCPVTQAVYAGRSQRLRLVVSHVRGEQVAVDAQAAPVRDETGALCGATLLMFDASSQVNLERQVVSLHEQVAQDSLTKVANRSEFDRRHEQLVRQHHEQGCPYSMIICDLDHFKLVNDTYGHPSGDEALIAFASVLRKHCRPGDLAARYGGEEFVVLCANTGTATATALAETMREAWAATSHPLLDGKCLTCSFGVTEAQSGDTTETMLRRADSALLQAKNNGRDQVVQLGDMAAVTEPGEERRRGWLSWRRTQPGDRLLQSTVVSSAPVKLAAEKLRGFVADRAARILEWNERGITLEVVVGSRRWGARRTPYLVELRFGEKGLAPAGRGNENESRTLFQVAIRPKRQRDCCRADAAEQAKQLLLNLKSYLMALDDGAFLSAK